MDSILWLIPVGTVIATLLIFRHLVIKRLIFKDISPDTLFRINQSPKFILAYIHRTIESKGEGSALLKRLPKPIRILWIVCYSVLLPAAIIVGLFFNLVLACIGILYSANILSIEDTRCSHGIEPKTLKCGYIPTLWQVEQLSVFILMGAYMTLLMLFTGGKSRSSKSKRSAKQPIACINCGTVLTDIAYDGIKFKGKCQECNLVWSITRFASLKP